MEILLALILFVLIFGVGALFTVSRYLAVGVAFVVFFLYLASGALF